MERLRSMVFNTEVRYLSGMKLIDFEVSQCIFKVKGQENITFVISSHSSSIQIDIKMVLFKITDHRWGQYMFNIM